MAFDRVPLLAFNRGIIDKKALARVDINRTAMSAEIQKNWIPRVLGSMTMRPGFEYIDSTRNDSKARHIPFVFATDDTAIIEFTDQKMRVRVDESIITRTPVSTTVQNGDFSSSTGWTDEDETGATSTITSNKLELVGTGFNRAIRTQQVSVASGDLNTEHALRIVVDRGPVNLRVGSTSGSDDYIGATLGEGEHSLTLTPTGDFYIQFLGIRQYTQIVSSCTVESAGDMEIDAPYAESDLKSIRTDQSADVIYIWCVGYQQYKIERRGTRAWSLVKYLPEDGPFRNINISPTTLEPSSTTGDITLTSSTDLFTSDHVGALFKIASLGQQAELDATGDNQWSNPIRLVEGNGRELFWEIAGTFSATVTVQRSIGEPGNWTTWFTRTAPDSGSSDTGFAANTIVYVRIGIATGDYTSGTAELKIESPTGSVNGIARITGFTDSKNVDAAVIAELGGTDPSPNWYEGQWSDRRGYPTSGALYEGRLFSAGNSMIIGSVSDAYESFDIEIEGDSAAIVRSIGRGPVDDILWMLALQRLVFGTAGSEWVARSSSFDEPLTPSNFNLKDPSNSGSANVNAVVVDTKGFFVQRGTIKLYQMIYDTSGVFDYVAQDMTELVPGIGRPGINRIDVQRQPDTRVHCIRNDGAVAMLVSEDSENVLAWVEIETSGEIEDVVVLPGEEEDNVYYVIKRTINGSTKRYLEKWAMESECVGGQANKQADSFKSYTSNGSATLTGLDHLEGEEIVIWADGKDYGTQTVSGGEVTLSQSVDTAIAGLYYAADYKSSKLAYASRYSTALTARKIVEQIGIVATDMHYQGLKYGSDFDNLSPLPLIERGQATSDDTVWETYDEDSFMFDGTYDSDSRVCLRAQAPRPCTLSALIVEMDTHDKRY